MQCYEKVWYETYGTRSIMFVLVWDMNTFSNACKTVISGWENLTYGYCFYTLCPKKTSTFYFSNNSVKN